MAVRFDRLYHRIHVVLNLPDFTEPYSFISDENIEHVALCIEVVFSLCWRNVSDGSEQAFVLNQSNHQSVAISRSGMLRHASYRWASLVL